MKKSLFNDKSGPVQKGVDARRPKRPDQSVHKKYAAGVADEGNEANAPFSTGPIRLKPLSQGLGLDHFADGLPYAPPPPQQTKPRPMVHFNFPPIKQSTMLSSAQSSTPSVAAKPVTQPIAKSIAQPILQSQVKKEITPIVINAGWSHRVFAYALDNIFILGIYTFLLWTGLFINGDPLTSIKNYHYFFPLFLLYLVIHVGYFLIQEISCQYTLGKALFKIRIQSESELATLVRVLCFPMAALPLGIGLFWYFFDSKRRCWHDVITDTEVIDA